jgi:hypothetical protein
VQGDDDVVYLKDKGEMMIPDGRMRDRVPNCFQRSESRWLGYALPRCIQRCCINVVDFACRPHSGNSPCHLDTPYFSI